MGWLGYCGEGKAYGYVVGKGDVEIGGDKCEEDGVNDDGGEGDENDETDDGDEENGDGGVGVNKEEVVEHDDVKLYMLTVSFGG